MHRYKTLPLGQSPFAPVLADRILHRFKGQGWGSLVNRVVALAKRAEDSRNDVDSPQFLAALGEAMRSGAMLPNSPLLVNCAETNPRLFACFAVLGDERAEFRLRLKYSARLGRELVEEPKSDVVTSAVVTLFRIAESKDYFHMNYYSIFD